MADEELFKLKGKNSHYQILFYGCQLDCSVFSSSMLGEREAQQNTKAYELIRFAW